MKLKLPHGSMDPERWHLEVEPEQRRHLTERLWSEPEILLEQQGFVPSVQPDIALVVMLGFDGQPTSERCVFTTGGQQVPERLISCGPITTYMGASIRAEIAYEVLSGCAWTRLSAEQLPSNVQLASDGRACVALIRYIRVS